MFVNDLKEACEMLISSSTVSPAPSMDNILEHVTKQVTTQRRAQYSTMQLLW